MALFEFTRDDIKKVINDERFLEGVRIAVEERFTLNPNYFRGDHQLLNLNIKEISSQIKNYSLPYLSFCEDPDYYANSYGEDNSMTLQVKSDWYTRQLLLEQAKDNLDPAWWCYIHECETQAIFILYPLCRLLFPDLQVYLYSGALHKVLINSTLNEYQTRPLSFSLTRDINQPCIFDLTSQLLKLDTEWIFDDLQGSIKPFDDKNIIKAENMIEWYVEQYGYQGIDSGRMKRWFQSLP